MKQKLTINGELPGLNEIIKAERTNKYIGAKLKKENTELVAWKCKELDKRIDELREKWLIK